VDTEHIDNDGSVLSLSVHPLSCAVCVDSVIQVRDNAVTHGDVCSVLYDRHCWRNPRILYRGKRRGRRRASSGSMNLTNEDNNEKERTPLVVIQNLQRYSVRFIKLLQSSVYYMCHQFNTQQFYVLHTQCIYEFCVDLRTNSDYFPVQHWLTGLYNRDGVYLKFIGPCIILIVE